jgi:cysteine desulfurase
LVDREGEFRRLQALRDALQSSLTERFPYLTVNGDPENHLPNILNISVDNARASVEGDMLVPTLDLEGVAVTSGSACTSGSMQPSHVLLAMGSEGNGEVLVRERKYARGCRGNSRACYGSAGEDRER